SEILETTDAPRGPSVSGRVEGQILRGSLQQKRKQEAEARRDWMSFEEAVVAAIDFHGALTGTGSYAPPQEARGGKFKGGGLGQALEEEMIWKDGMLMNPGLLEYRSPSSIESPEVECFIVESIDPEGPFGAKECSEGSLAATIPAIANAIYDAVGVRLREAPFTPERVLAALREQNNAKKLNLTEGVDPTAPARLREHGGSLWFRGKGPLRHALDPARATQSLQAGGDD